MDVTECYIPFYVSVSQWSHWLQEQQSTNAGWRAGRLRDSVHKLKLREEQDSQLLTAVQGSLACWKAKTYNRYQQIAAEKSQQKPKDTEPRW